MRLSTYANSDSSPRFLTNPIQQRTRGDMRAAVRLHPITSRGLPNKPERHTVRQRSARSIARSSLANPISPDCPPLISARYPKHVPACQPYCGRPVPVLFLFSRCLRTTPRASSVTVTEATLVGELEDGRTLSAPLAWYPRLTQATPAERANWRLLGRGEGIHWPAVDEDISVESLLAGRASGETQESLQRWLATRGSAA